MRTDRIIISSVSLFLGCILLSCGERNANLVGDAHSAYSEPMEEFEDDLEGLALSGRKNGEKKKSENQASKKKKNSGALSSKAGQKKKKAMEEKRADGMKTGHAVGAVVAKSQFVEGDSWNRRCAEAAAAFNPPHVTPLAAAVTAITVKHPLICHLDVRGTQLVVQSLHVPGLSEGDVVKLRGEMGYTNDVATLQPQAGSSKYKDENRYTVEVNASLIQSKVDKSVVGQQLAAGSTKTTPMAHHGVVGVFGEMTFRPEAGEFFHFLASSRVVGNPNPTGVAKRKNENARAPAPSDDPFLYVEQGSNRTKLDVLILKMGWENFFSSREIRSLPDEIKEVSVRRGNRYVVVSLSLGAVNAGEVIDVEGKLRVISRRKDGPQLATGEIVLSSSPQSVYGDSITIKFGENLAPNSSGTIQRSGAIRVTKDYPQAWINFVANTMSDLNSDGYYDVIRAGSGVKVTRYTPKQ
jgi:hypothetical protein